MAATYTAGSGTDLDRVRLLIADTTVANALLEDEEITDLLDLEGSLFLAAAQALDIIATSEVLVLKKIRLLNGDISTDGPAVAKSLRERADTLRARAVDEDTGFAIIELALDQHTSANQRFNRWLKSGGA